MSRHAPRDRIALHLLQFGAVAIVLASLPYKAFDLDRYFVPKELVLHVCAALTALLLISRRRQLTFTVIDLLLVGFLLASTASAIFAPNLWAAQRALAVSFSGAALYWVTSTLRREGLVRSLVVALALGVVVGAATSLAQAYGLQTEYFSLNRVPGGTFGNRNFVAHLAAIGTPVVVLAALTAKGGLNAAVGGIGMAILAAALVLSRSRAAWLAVIALAVPVGSIAYLTRERWREARTARRLATLMVASAIGIAAAILLPNRLEWKSDSPYLDSAAGLVNYKEGSGRGRLVQYTNSLRIAESYPLLGIGPGNWPVVYPKYASRNDPSMAQEDGITANPWPSSDWVAFLAERGGLGFGLLLFTLVALLGRAINELRVSEGHNPERVLTALALIGTLVATVVVGAFDAVLLLAVPTFFLWTLAGALAPPAMRGGPMRLTWGVRELAPVVVVVLALVAVGRSSGQLAAMSLVNNSTRVASLERAAMLDPGSYRIHIRVARSYAGNGNCQRARPHARAARHLFPSAGEARRLGVTCGQ